MADVTPLIRDELLPPARPRAAAPDLDRRPDERRRRAAARRSRAPSRASLEREVKKLPDAQGPHRRQPLLRVLDADVVELRARREAALGGRDVDQGDRLGGGQGRVPEGHGAHDRRLRPGRHRHPSPAHRRAPGHRPRRRRTSSTRATGRTSIRPRRSSTSTRSTRSSAGSRACTSRSSATSSIRGSRARTSRRSSSWARRVTVVGPPPLIPRGIEAMGCEVSYDIETIKRRRRRLRPAHAARAHARGRELRARACASTPRAGA